MAFSRRANCHIYILTYLLIMWAMHIAIGFFAGQPWDLDAPTHFNHFACLTYPIFLVAVLHCRRIYHHFCFASYSILQKIPIRRPLNQSDTLSLFSSFHPVSLQCIA
ncbi:hypothetical protein F5X97DRAFT_265899 [Nemania serpens]|nr:hypothetical protein F5X97DRAFT_265899 [Nemania serpens]